MSQLPSSHAPIVDHNGYATQVFYRWLAGFYNQAGGSGDAISTLTAQLSTAQSQLQGLMVQAGQLATELSTTMSTLQVLDTLQYTTRPAEGDGAGLRSLIEDIGALQYVARPVDDSARLDRLAARLEALDAMQYVLRISSE